MLRQSRSRPTTPSRFSASSLNNNNISETKKDDRSSERRSSHSLTRSPMVLKPSHWSREMKEVTLITKKDGVFNFRIVGGSDHGEFPVISEVMPPDTRGVEYSGSRDITTQVNKYFIICWRLQTRSENESKFDLSWTHQTITRSMINWFCTPFSFTFPDKIPEQGNDNWLGL